MKKVIVAHVLTDAFTTPDANSRSLTPLIRFELQPLSGGGRNDSVIVECWGSASKKTTSQPP